MCFSFSPPQSLRWWRSYLVASVATAPEQFKLSSRSVFRRCVSGGMSGHAHWVRSEGQQTWQVCFRPAKLFPLVVSPRFVCLFVNKRGHRKSRAGLAAVLLQVTGGANGIDGLWPHRQHFTKKGLSLWNMFTLSPENSPRLAGGTLLVTIKCVCINSAVTSHVGNWKVRAQMLQKLHKNGHSCENSFFF